MASRSSPGMLTVLIGSFQEALYSLSIDCEPFHERNLITCNITLKVYAKTLDFPTP